MKIYKKHILFVTIFIYNQKNRVINFILSLSVYLDLTIKYTFFNIMEYVCRFILFIKVKYFIFSNNYMTLRL